MWHQPKKRPVKLYLEGAMVPTMEKNLICATKKRYEEGSNVKAVDIMDSGRQAVSRYMVVNINAAFNILMLLSDEALLNQVKHRMNQTLTRLIIAPHPPTPIQPVCNY